MTRKPLQRLTMCALLAAAAAGTVGTAVAEQHGMTSGDTQAQSQGQHGGGDTTTTMKGGMAGGMMGPGMMGGMGQDMMGPGMMGGMGQDMMGPGMMGGMGQDMMGPGMMGGMGQGMMGPGMIATILDLTEDQQKEIATIQKETAQKQWGLMQQMHERATALRELYQAEQPDAQAIGKAHERVFEVRRKMIENMIEARNRKHAVFTDEQRETMRKMRGMGVPAN